MATSLSQYLGLAALLFTVGAVGVVVRRNVLTVLMSIELMLNAANLTFVAFSRFPLKPMTAMQAAGGHAAAFFVIATAAAVGLAIVIAVFRRRVTTQVDQLNLIRDAAPYAENLTALPPAHPESH